MLLMWACGVVEHGTSLGGGFSILEYQVKVDKDQFDALLQRLTNADPAKRQDLKTEDKKPKRQPERAK
jgi:hypothetical protein